MKNKIQLIFSLLLILILCLSAYVFFTKKNSTQNKLAEINNINKTLESNFGYKLDLEQKYIDELAMTCKDAAGAKYVDNTYIKCYTKNKNPYAGLGFKNKKLTDTEIKNILKNRALKYFSIKNISDYKCANTIIATSASSSVTTNNNLRGVVTCNIGISKTKSIESAYYDLDPSKDNSNIIISMATMSQEVPDATINLVESIVSKVKTIQATSKPSAMLNFGLEKAYAQTSDGPGADTGSGSGLGDFSDVYGDPINTGGGAVTYTCPSGVIVSYSSQCLTCPYPKTVGVLNIYTCFIPGYTLGGNGETDGITFPSSHTPYTTTIQICQIALGQTLITRPAEYCATPAPIIPAPVIPVAPVVNIKFR